MTKKEFYQENYENLLVQAKEDLTDYVKRTIEMSGDDSIHLTDHHISPPIYNGSASDDMSEVIYSVFIDDDGKVGFGLDSDCDISIDDIDMDMTLHLMGEFEWLELLFRNKVI
jgi:hypothetical protein